MRISTPLEFEAWLSDCAWLEHAEIEDIQPRRLTAGIPATVELRLAIQATAGWRAGDVVEVRHVTLTAMGVSEFSLEDGDFFAGHCCQGAEELQSGSPVAFELDVPGPLRLACAVLDIVETNAQEIIPARFSDREYRVSATGQLLSPSEWEELFAMAGLSVAWRTYGGPADHAGDVPADYTGWFLQLSERMEATSGGVFFSDCAQRGPRMSLLIANSCADGPALWVASSVLVARLPDVQIECGNTSLDATEWLKHVSACYGDLELVSRLLRMPPTGAG